MTRPAAVGEALRGWQPIETAPKDGETVLLFYTVDHDEVELGIRPIDCPDDAAADSTMHVAFYPDYWAPLPPPPPGVADERPETLAESAAALAAPPPPEGVDRWLTQTTFYDPAQPDACTGNCTETALASILGLPLDAVPSMAGLGGMDFWDAFDAFLASRGFWAYLRDGNFQPEGLYLASGQSSRGCAHMVVMEAGKLRHDPHPSREGIKSVEHVWTLVPFDPARIAAKPEADAGAVTAAPWLEELCDQRAHLRLAIKMMRDFPEQLRGCDHDADVADWDAVLRRFEATFDDVFDWAERNRVSALASRAPRHNGGAVDALREALVLARPYVESDSQRMYDGTNGHGIRTEAKRRLAIIDAALAAHQEGRNG